MDIKDIQKLEKVVKEQAEQIKSMKKAMTVIQRRLIQVSKQSERTYHSCRKNSNDINSIARVVHKNK